MDLINEPLHCLVNGEPRQSLSVFDRGLHYGDGVFETIAFRNASLEFWDLHMRRLNYGCQQLHIPPPDEGLLRQEALHVAKAHGEGVIKIIITRGSQGRGYQAITTPKSTRLVIYYPLPEYLSENATQGIHAIIRKTRLNTHPNLLRIKHLNCLQYVLASQELQSSASVEGFMQNTQGALIEGTRSNLFLVKNNTLYTPCLKHDGIPGIMRQVIMECSQQHGIPVIEDTITFEFLKGCSEVFICNSIIQICPVIECAGIQFRVGAHTRQLQKLIGRIQHD